MNHRIIHTVLASTLGMAALGFVGTGPALAKSGDIVVRGTCSGRSVDKLKLQPRGATIEFDFEVDSNVNGQRWQVRLTDNGSIIRSGTFTTVAPSGSFSVSGRTSNRAGVDKFVARATNAATGESCVLRAQL